MRALASAQHSAVQLIDTRRIDCTTRLGGPSEQVTTVFSVAEAKSHNSHATSSTQKHRKGKKKRKKADGVSRCTSCRACTDLFVCLLSLVLLSLDLVLLHLACVFLLLVEEVLDDVGLVEEESVGGDDGDLGGLARQVAAVERL